MSDTERRTRLKRVVKALESLRQAQIARQAGSNMKHTAAAALAVELDSVNLETSHAWALFPKNWLNFRSKLDQEMTEHLANANIAAAEALRIEKTAEKISGIIVKIDKSEASKQAASEILEYISGGNLRGKPALDKFTALDSSKR